MPVSPFLELERDDRFKFGRAKASGGTIYYCVPGCTISTVGTVGLDGATDEYSAWFTPTPLVIDLLAAEVVTGSGTNLRIGFYAADTNWQPVGGPLADSGNLDATTAAVKTYTPGTPIFVPRGRYLSVINADTNPVMRTFIGTSQQAIDPGLGATSLVHTMEAARAYAAFPTPGTAWSVDLQTSTGMRHKVVYRVSAP